MIITVAHTISMGHRLPSYDGMCSSPHGHNVRFEVVVESRDFLDFKEVTRLLRSVIEDMDHAMVLHREDPLLLVLMGMKFRTYTMEEEPTTEAIAYEVYRELKHKIARYSGRARLLEVIVHETDKYSASHRAYPEDL